MYRWYERKKGEIRGTQSKLLGVMERCPKTKHRQHPLKGFKKKDTLSGKLAKGDQRGFGIAIQSGQTAGPERRKKISVIRRC